MLSGACLPEDTSTDPEPARIDGFSRENTLEGKTEGVMKQALTTMSSYHNTRFCLKLLMAADIANV